MKITIVTITYNAASVLLPTLQSLRSQTCQDFEHLIIDGASKDGTLALLSENPTPGMRVLSEPDHGLYDAMNKGLRMARGEYVLFLNAGDTFSAPDVLEAYMREAEKGCDIIYSDTDIMDSTGRVTGHRHLSVPERLDKRSFSRGMLVCHQAFMVRRALAPEYDLAYRFSADYDWTVKCIENSDPERNANLHRVGIHYLSDGLTDKNKLKSLKERYKIMASHYGKFHAFFLHCRLIIGKMCRKGIT